MDALQLAILSTDSQRSIFIERAEAQYRWIKTNLADVERDNEEGRTVIEQAAQVASHAVNFASLMSGVAQMNEAMGHFAT